jgi:MFS family permease
MSARVLIRDEPNLERAAAPHHRAHDVWIAATIVAALMVVYNANGREIGSYDSQPNKFAARELLLRHTLALNHIVGAVPQLGERPAFALARDGRYRSAYSPVPAVLAAAIAWPIWKAGLLDIRSGFAPNIIAVLAASLLTALAVALAYWTARQRTTEARALFVAAGLGLGTGYWSSISQTLWIHETAILGLAIAVLAFAAPTDRISDRAALVSGAGLALAAVARMQLAPVVAVLLAGLFWRANRRGAIGALLIVAAAAILEMSVYLRWFGQPLGMLPALDAVSRSVHRTPRTFALTLDGFAGLLISPNRGLLIFSPVVLVALVGLRAALAEDWRRPLRWCALAAAAQYSLYSTYGVWWGGHTYGPRYLLDVLPLLVPFAALVVAHLRVRSVAGFAASTALAWSICVAATGAFYYPNDGWNGDPVDVNRHHARLWSWSDMQIMRCWQRGPAPQNFNLFTRDAWRVTPPR